jgi:hypothetical protein
VSGTFGGSAVSGSPVVIPVTLYVGTVYKTFVPTVMRNAR